MPAPRLGLIANTTKRGAPELADLLVRELLNRGMEVRLEAATSRAVEDDVLKPLLKSGGRLSYSTAEMAGVCDLVVVLGGDGTMLQVLRELGEAAPPMFGINLGTLGFLTCVGAGDWEAAVECIATGSYRLSERTLLTVEVHSLAGEKVRMLALNDAVISRGELSRLIRLGVRVSGQPLTEYNADGLIVATPTGSTAYSLSAGGPVLTPNSGVFVITPICPHVLTNRSVIVSDGAMIEIAPVEGSSSVFLTVDGQDSVRVEPGDVIRVTKANRRLSLAMLPGTTFFEVLRQKLKWSGAVV